MIVVISKSIGSGYFSFYSHYLQIINSKVDIPSALFATALQNTGLLKPLNYPITFKWHVICAQTIG